MAGTGIGSVSTEPTAGVSTDALNGSPPGLPVAGAAGGADAPVCGLSEDEHDVPAITQTKVMTSNIRRIRSRTRRIGAVAPPKGSELTSVAAMSATRWPIDF